MAKIDPRQAEWKQPLADVFNALDGSIQSQGVRLSARDWLDMGSPGWQETSDELKARAYQAAQVTGWSDEAIVDLMVEAVPHLDKQIMEYTVGLLRKLSEANPAKVEEVYEPEIAVEIKKEDR